MKIITKSIVVLTIFTLAISSAYSQADLNHETDFFDTTGLAPALVNFSTEAEAQKLAQTRKVIYFFAAEWCELCRADLHQLKTRTKEIPPDTTIVLVDFDNADELRIKYGIPLQDVFLRIDAQGKKVKLWVGGGLAALKKNVQ